MVLVMLFLKSGILNAVVSLVSRVGKKRGTAVDRNRMKSVESNIEPIQENK